MSKVGCFHINCFACGAKVFRQTKNKFDDIPLNCELLLILNLFIMKITDKIRKLRSVKNISQEFVANALKIDTSSYYRLESGISPLSVERLEIISAVFGMSMCELLSFGEDVTSNTPVNFPKKPEQYNRHLEEEILFLRKQLQEKEHQLSVLLNLQKEHPVIKADPPVTSNITAWR